ncbi:MAG: ankyrin repeat domain-containing protein [Pseudomonadota bacterium]
MRRLTVVLAALAATMALGSGVWACNAEECNDYAPDLKDFIRLACEGANCSGDHHIDVRGLLRLSSWDCPPNSPPGSCSNYSNDIKSLLMLACNDPNCSDDFRKELKDMKKLACDNPNCEDDYAPDLKGLLRLACDDPNCDNDYAPGRGSSSIALVPKNAPLAAGAISKGINPASTAQGKATYSLDEAAIERLQKADAKDFPVLTAFLNKRIPVDAKDSKGNTLLFYSAVKGDAPAVQFLLSKGADPKCTNKNGCTPMDCAKAKGHKAVVSVLEKTGSK